MVVSVMKWVALTTLIAAGLVQIPSPVVRVSSGLLRGRLDPGGTYYQYFGVPYGTVDETNRFQAPLPPPTWEGVYNAVEENTWCPQKFFGTNIPLGHPNCLKVNIYAPVTTSLAPTERFLPVMVFIHGGCFFEGSGTRFFYGGDYFTDHGVIFVGINYRLNVEGFLCLGIKEAPGNAGLKDQIAALKWIKQNIRAFGGDPDNVTLFGESAGAVSISFLMLSPSANGLFHKAILQSGSSLAPWGIQHDPIGIASALVKEFGYNTKDPHEIYNILSNIPYNDLIQAIKYSETKNWVTADILFVPCVENEIEGVEPIITQFPLEIISLGNYTKVPMIIGYNDREGIFFVAKDFGTSVKEVDTAEFLKNDLVFSSTLEKNDTANKVRDYYFSSEQDELIMSVVDLYSDLHFKFPSIIEMEMYARTTDESLFFYLFRYSGYMNVPKMVSFFTGVRGASHADELFYMMRPNVLPMPQRWFDLHDQITLQMMLTMWTNFAKYSDPTPVTSDLLPIKWLPSREWNPRALVIDHILTTAPLWDESSARFWNDTYNKYRRKDYGFHHLNMLSFSNKGDCCDFNRPICKNTTNNL
ncbi:unnamed protein product [Chilo suppressalis]|uniref:Carboxylic ester hydrolase n=1 Tax=Chilo suppressalis TaxID=168631 RepID=A0ABN8L7V8_CHISP|nr:unnamed protein product [Chilo suppressalis]